MIWASQRLVFCSSVLLFFCFAVPSFCSRVPPPSVSSHFVYLVPARPLPSRSWSRLVRWTTGGLGGLGHSEHEKCVAQRDRARAKCASGACRGRDATGNGWWAMSMARPWSITWSIKKSRGRSSCRACLSRDAAAPPPPRPPTRQQISAGVWEGGESPEPFPQFHIDSRLLIGKQARSLESSPKQRRVGPRTFPAPETRLGLGHPGRAVQKRERGKRNSTSLQRMHALP